MESENLLVITGSYGYIKGDLQLLNEANENIDFDKFDHVVEGDLKVKLGEL